MKNAINELSHIIEGHYYVADKKDLSVILNTRDMLELVQLTNVARYDETNISYEGEYHIVSSIVGEETLFFVEDVKTEDGILKYDETDVLIIPNYLPQEIRDHFVNQGGFEKLIEINEDSTFEEIANKFEN